MVVLSMSGSVVGVSVGMSRSAAVKTQWVAIIYAVIVTRQQVAPHRRKVLGCRSHPCLLAATMIEDGYMEVNWREEG